MAKVVSFHALFAVLYDAKGLRTGALGWQKPSASYAYLTNILLNSFLVY